MSSGKVDGTGIPEGGSDAPSTAELCRERGNQAMRMGDITGALFHYNQGLDEAPSDVRLLSNKAIACIRLERFEDALRAAEAGIAADPTFVKVHVSKGDALVHLNRPREAVTAYECARSACDGEVPTRLMDKLRDAQRRAANPSAPPPGPGSATFRSEPIPWEATSPLKRAQEGARGLSVVLILVYALSGILLPADLGSYAYYIALVLGCALNAYRVYAECNVIPWSDAGAQRAFRHSSLYLAFTALSFLAGRPLILVPLVVFAFEVPLFFIFVHDMSLQFNPKAAELLVQAADAIGPALTSDEAFASKSRPERLNLTNRALKSFVAQSMLTLAGLLLLDLIFRPNFLLLIIHLQQIRFQTLADDDLRNAIGTLDTTLRGYASSVPSIAPYYHRLSTFIASFDPRLQLNEPSSASSSSSSSMFGNIASSIQRACTIA